MASENALAISATTDLRDQDFSLHALNFDNQIELDQLRRIFILHYGPTHPYLQYLNNDAHTHSVAIEEQEPAPYETSLVIDSKHGLVAHFALRQQSNPLQTELLYPAVDPGYRRFVFHFSRMLAQHISQLAVRQKWDMIFHYSFVFTPYAQIIATKCFNATSTALFPEKRDSAQGVIHINDSRSRSRMRQDLVSMYSFLSPPHGHRCLYPPRQHAAVIRSLCNRLGIDRELCESEPSVGNSERTDSILAGHFSVSRPGLEQIFVKPTSCHPLDIVHSAINRSKIGGSQVSIAVSLNDPACPNFCVALEAHGFRFCGILPCVDGNDYIAYCQYQEQTLLGLNLYDPTAKQLRSYMLGQCQRRS